MNLSVVGATAALQAYCNMFDNATLSFYSGTEPSTPETALSGNTLSATFTFTAGAFATPTFSSGTVSAVANFTTATVTPSSTQNVSFARATLETAATWATSTAYSAGAVVKDTTSGNTYVCITAGTSASAGNGPIGTGTAIVDGSVAWMYIGSTSGIVAIGDFTVGTSGTDIIVGSTAFNTGVQVNLSSFKLTIPAV